jgi:hypothetical protein
MIFDFLEGASVVWSGVSSLFWRNASGKFNKFVIHQNQKSKIKNQKSFFRLSEKFFLAILLNCFSTAER